MEYRKPTDWYQVEHANLHNLKNVNVKLPLGVMTVIAGVAGSGKSSLMEYFTSQYPGEVISIRQKDIGINLRSTPATYLDIADEAGGIATIATILAMDKISIKNIGIIHNREFEQGVLKIEFYEEDAMERAIALLKKRNYIVYER